MNRISFTGFYIRKIHFQKIIYHSKDVLKITFQNCTIDCENVRFISEHKYKIKEMEFIKCSPIEEYSWKESTEMMVSIIMAISKCPLKESLENIFFLASTFEPDMGRIEDIVEEHELQLKVNSCGY
mmetsp:Transcript_17137/g.15112  ORF Transcript_17137/g.15112 Transcript_17137/m.15112 type:complete len:126 (+) Transcript_17137:371-748(+)